jgi:hypothetical protein
MTGNEQIRFCGQCNLNVYNLSGMTKREAEALITRNEGRLCVRYYRRKDGTILTDNCPVGLRALKRRVSRLANAMMSAVVGFCSGFGVNLLFAEGAVGDVRPVQYRTMGAMVPLVQGEIVEAEQPIAPVPFNGPVAMGRMASVPQEPDGGWVEGQVVLVEEKKVGRRRAGK